MLRKLFFLLAIFIFLYILFLSPKVVATTPVNSSNAVDVKSAITVKFSVPVSRRALEKTISPEVPGVWKFEDPVYPPYLLRQVTFYPDAGLNSNTNYTVKISNIKNVFQIGKPGNLTFSFKTKDAPPAETKALKVIQSETVKLAVPAYLQQHTLSCEVSSLRMALAYKGVNKTEDELLSLVGYDNTPHVGGTWGNPYEHFVGNVNGNQMRDGYGVYWGPIERVAKMYGGAQAFQNGDIKLLTSNILKGNPVIIWVYSSSGAPTHWKTPSGLDIFAVAGEHTVVVVGYVGPADNPTQIIVNDSLSGQVYWSRDKFNQRWATFSQSGVVIFK
ncbi:MAG TPA: C39 family peptidase [Patescibacteria group bacterium]|nr:C39 family peptidase [Patescibacteria group bacterium]